MARSALPFKPNDLMVGRPELIVKIFQHLRAVLHDRLPNVEERAIPAAKIVHYLLRRPVFIDGPVIALGPTNTHVTLFFVHGESISDPDNLLERFGSRLYGVNIVDEYQPEHPSISALIDSARDFRRLKKG